MKRLPEMTPAERAEFAGAIRELLGLRPLRDETGLPGALEERLRAALREGPRSLGEVAVVVGRGTPQACRVLGRMARRGEVRRVGPGRWALSEGA